MKQFITLMLAFLLILSMVGCAAIGTFFVPAEKEEVEQG